MQLTIILGAILTILIIYLFLNSWRSTVITGLTLPVSIISAFFIMWVFNFTVEHDDAARAVARDRPADRRRDRRAREHRAPRGNGERPLHGREGRHRRDRPRRSSATTLAVVAVFFPVAFMGGMIGTIFFQFGVTVAFAVLVSLFVSFTLDPMLSSVWPDPEVEGATVARHIGTITTQESDPSLLRSRSTAGSSASPTVIRDGSAGRSSIAWIVIGVAAASIVGAFADRAEARLHLDAGRRHR